MLGHSSKRPGAGTNDPHRSSTMKAVIPAAGFGTRFLPLAKAVPKELLPFGAEPVIHHVVAEARQAGCTEIGIVLSVGKEAIRRYFEPDPVLDATLAKRGKSDLLTSWRQLVEGLRFTFLDQPEQRGLGDAVACARDFVGDEPFCVLLGDTVIDGTSPLPDMARTLSNSGTGSVAVQPIPPERAGRYGVCGGDLIQEGTFELDSLVEKPTPDRIPVMRDRSGSPLPAAYPIAARYAFPPSIFEHLGHTRGGVGGEIQLTDAMEALRKASGFQARELTGTRLDIGTPEGLAFALAEKGI